MADGHSKTRLYSIWCNMKCRCYNPKDPRYNCYGGKGITICDEWKNSFNEFAEWALNNGYEDPPIGADRKWLARNSLTIDRIDSNKGYSPDNCRWISFQENRCRRGICHNESNFFIGGNLRAAREKAGFTQTELAEITGFTNKVISNWETGFAHPSLGKALLLASIYGITVEELVGSESEI